MFIYRVVVLLKNGLFCTTWKNSSRNSPKETYHRGDHSTSRGLFSRGKGPDFVHGYTSRLDFDIVNFLAEREHQKGHCLVLDLGCGSATYVDDVNQLSENIQAFGVTRDLYHTKVPRNRIIKGDFIFPTRPNYILEQVPDSSIDLVTSIFAAYGFPANLTSVLFKQVERILKPGGLAKLDMLAQYGGTPIKEIIQELSTSGMDISWSEPLHVGDPYAETLRKACVNITIKG